MENKNVNHPSHYNQYPIETIEMMERIFGREKTRDWCIMTAFKYRMRLGHKDNYEQDFAKEQWYLNKAAELSSMPLNSAKINEEDIGDIIPPFSI